MRFLLLLCATVIFSVGLLMIFSTTSADFLDHDLDKSPHHIILKQIIYALVGIGLACVVQKIGYHRLLHYSPLFLAFFTVLLILVLIPGVGREVNGSKRWLSIAGFSFQPSEFVKYIAPAYFIHTNLSSESVEWSLKRFIRLVTFPAMPIVLILIEPNNGTAGVVALVLVVLCLLMNIPVKYWAIPLAVAFAFAAASAYHLPYVKGRFNVYWHPELDLHGKGHQPYQAKIAAGSGGLFGKGPGSGLQKLSYLPEAQNDYIAAIFAEEFGFVGIIFLLSLYALLACLAFQVAMLAYDKAGFYWAGGILFLLSFQAFLNLGVVSGLLPSTGLNLPFFSQGGSSLMANIVGVGILFNIASFSLDVKKSANNHKTYSLS